MTTQKCPHCNGTGRVLWTRDVSRANAYGMRDDVQVTSDEDCDDCGATGEADPLDGIPSDTLVDPAQLELIARDWAATPEPVRAAWRALDAGDVRGVVRALGMVR